MTEAGTALVTGGTGFIGAHLVRRMAAAGWRVRTCGRSDRPADLPGGIDYQQVDLTADAPLDTLLDGVTHVVHAAGASSSNATPEQMQRINVAGTANLLEAAAAAGVQRVVHVSTSSIYGKKVQLPLPVPEDVEPHPGAGYAASKWEAEEVARRMVDKGLDVAILRPTTVYGPRAVKLVASTILDAAIERYAGLDAFAVPAEPVELRLIHVDDVVGACMHLARQPDVAGRAFNLTSGTYPSSLEVAGVVAGELGLELDPTDDPEPGLGFEERAAVHARMQEQGLVPGIMLKKQRIRLLRKTNPNNRLSMDALRATGFAPTRLDLDETIPASIRWYRDRRWIL